MMYYDTRKLTHLEVKYLVSYLVYIRSSNVMNAEKKIIYIPHKYTSAQFTLSVPNCKNA